MQLTEYTKTLQFHASLIIALHIGILMYFSYWVFIGMLSIICTTILIAVAYQYDQLVKQYERSFDTVELLQRYK